ncbi:hypothetical protein [Actinocrispum wychmicini]|uniref:Uncharacterized protein n=1 Tax=Actinocrispum wychmicini TaxID=1213861 RepID=A0A4R2JSK7_9PSEU|nr:hypothetical protein [Actinocrispum wychmicini]TCO57155.1 hypothetical protein EV192_106632 [Actinocrispum wychmicini]
MTTARYTVHTFQADTAEGGGTKYAVIDTTRTPEQGRVVYDREIGGHLFTRDHAQATQWADDLNTQNEKLRAAGAEFVANARTVVLGEVLSADSGREWPELGYTRRDILDQLHDRALAEYTEPDPFGQSEKSHRDAMRKTAAWLFTYQIHMELVHATGYYRTALVDELHARAQRL